MLLSARTILCGNVAWVKARNVCRFRAHNSLIAQACGCMFFFSLFSLLCEQGPGLVAVSFLAMSTTFLMPISQRKATILHSISFVFLQPCLSRALVKRPAGTWKRGLSSPSQHGRPTFSASASSKAGILLIGDEILSGKVSSLPGIPSPLSALSVSFPFNPSHSLSNTLIRIFVMTGGRY